MKKIVMLTSTALLALTSFANAQDTTETNKFFFKPEIGIDYSYSTLEIDSPFDRLYGDDFNNINLSLGARVHKNIGLELNMSKSDDMTHTTAGVKTEANYKSIGMDVNLYHPMTNNLEGFATVGAVYYDFDIKASNGSTTISTGDSTVSPRVGAGLQYKLNDKFAVKSSIAHSFINDLDMESLTDFKVGLRYSF